MPSHDYYNKIEPELAKLGLQDFNGKLIAIANDKCRNCSNWILDNGLDYGDTVVIVYDAASHGKKGNTAIGKHRFVQSSNDKLARFTMPGVSGHRIYSIRNRRITHVQELNSSNVDSIITFIKR